MKRIGLIIVTTLLFIGNVKSQEITNEEKLHGLSLYWSEAKYNFAYFDRVKNLDWDSLYQAYIPKVLNTKTNFEYFKEMQSFAAHLKDGHSLVLLLDHLTEHLDELAISIREFDDKYYVVNTDKILSAKVPLGSEIIKIDDYQIDDFISENIKPYISASTEHALKYKIAENLLKGDKNTKIIITIKDKNNKISTVNLIRNSDEIMWEVPIDNPKSFEFKIVNENIAYIQLNSFFYSEIIDDFKEVLPEIRKCKGVIFDVRNNDGGDADLGLQILEYFSDSDFYRLPYKTRKHIAAYKAWGIYQLYQSGTTKFMDYATDNAWLEKDAEIIPNTSNEKINIPIVLLAGNKTYSAGEDFVVFAKQLGDKVKIVGEPTSGSSGQVLMFLLPGGALASICAKRDYFTDNTKFIGYGLQPDYFIKPTINDILDKKDIVLKRALELFD